jgi:hypothetical protein
LPLDLDRLGGLAWTEKSRGKLSNLERTRLLGRMVGTAVHSGIGLLAFKLGRSPRCLSELDPSSLEPPDTDFARAVEEACAEQSVEIVEHSYRTWMLGRALATIDCCPLDPELFYCAALLHDYGLITPTKDGDFTLASAARAKRCLDTAGRGGEEGEVVADAICVHPTAGLSIGRDGPLGCYLQWGAMADLVGLRLMEIGHSSAQQIFDAHPRGPGLNQYVVDKVRAEASAVPGGRFALYLNVGMAVALRLANVKP